MILFLDSCLFFAFYFYICLMKIHKMLFTFLICMISFAVFSNTSEPKQKPKTEITQSFVKNLDVVIFENVKNFTDVKASYAFNVNQSKVEKLPVNSNYLYFDVGRRFKGNYNITNFNYSAFKHAFVKKIDFRIRSDCQK